MLKCVVCGRRVPNPRPNKKHCSRACAQRGYNKRWKWKNRDKVRAQKRRWWSRRWKDRPGTFDPEYLSIRNCRVNGAVLLEKGTSINNFSLFNGGRPQCECGSNLLVNLVGPEVYCGECGSKIVLALENEYYSMPVETVCDGCGLVYEVPQFPFFSIWGENDTVEVE